VRDSDVTGMTLESERAARELPGIFGIVYYLVALRRTKACKAVHAARRHRPLALNLIFCEHLPSDISHKYYYYENKIYY